MVEFASFNHEPMETPMTENNMTLIELLQKHDEGDFLRAVTEAVLQTLMEHDVEGVIGAGRYERGDGRQTYRNGYRDRELKTRPEAQLVCADRDFPRFSTTFRSSPHRDSLSMLVVTR